MNEPAIKKVLDYQNYFMHDEKLRYKYELQEKAMRDYNSSMLVAKEEGIEQGIQKEKIHAAINFLKLGIDIETVSKGTGLNIDEVINLSKQI